MSYKSLLLLDIEWFYFDYSLDGNGRSKTDKMYEWVLYVSLIIAL